MHNYRRDDPVQTVGGWAAFRDAMFAQASMTPGDIDMVQVYDDYPVIALMQLEDLGFCQKGAGGRFLAETDLSVTGTLPVNTGGGQLSAGAGGCGRRDAGGRGGGEAASGSGRKASDLGRQPRSGVGLRQRELRSLRLCERDDPERRVMTDPAAVPPVPAPSSPAGDLLEGLAAGFRLQHCQACGRVVYYPRVACPACLSPDLEWRETDPEGEVLSFGHVWRPLHPAFVSETPPCLCSVRLRAGPVVIAVLEGCPPEDVRTGLPVRVFGSALPGRIFVLRLVPER